MRSLAEFAAMSKEAMVVRALCMFMTCFSCALAQLKSSSSPLTGHDVTLSVLNISNKYTDACSFETYIISLCNSMNIPIQRGNRETRHAMQILAVNSPVMIVAYMDKMADKFSISAITVMALSPASLRRSHQYGCDVAIRVENMSKTYLEGCTANMYSTFLCDVAHTRAMPQLNIPPQGKSNYSLEVVQKRRVAHHVDIMCRITYSDGVEAENPASTFTQCQLLHGQQPYPQLTSKNRWMNTTVYMMPNSTHDFGYLHQDSKYVRCITVFISPPDTVTHLQFVFMKVECNNTDQEVVVYMSKKKYKLCRPEEAPLSEICGQPFNEWPVNRDRFRVIGGDLTPIRSQPWTVFVKVEIMALSSESVSSTHQYGCDMTIRVKNMSKVYTRGCTSDMYAKFVSDVAYIRAMAQLNIPAQGHSNYSVEMPKVKEKIGTRRFQKKELYRHLIRLCEKDPNHALKEIFNLPRIDEQPDKGRTFEFYKASFEVALSHDMEEARPKYSITDRLIQAISVAEIVAELKTLAIV
ncbi:unnamed protein product [Soboliphyme baturini]|uniref:ZP domain-containing protein n=1 Tax=Soboliphyme baturini TaxID=241478 RepID=A0A183IPS2_9BILA|nr:unnamed protein product [Soboliphyme baturini]